MLLLPQRCPHVQERDSPSFGFKVVNAGGRCRVFIIFWLCCHLCDHFVRVPRDLSHHCPFLPQPAGAASCGGQVITASVGRTARCKGHPLMRPVIYFMERNLQATTPHVAQKHVQTLNVQRPCMYLHPMRGRKVGMFYAWEWKVLWNTKLCVGFCTYSSRLYFSHFRLLIFCSFLSHLNLEMATLNPASTWLSLECYSLTGTFCLWFTGTKFVRCVLFLMTALCCFTPLPLSSSFSYLLVTKTKKPNWPGLTFQLVGRVWCWTVAPPSHQPETPPRLVSALSWGLHGNPHVTLRVWRGGGGETGKDLVILQWPCCTWNFTSFLLLITTFLQRTKCTSYENSDP